MAKQELKGLEEREGLKEMEMDAAVPTSSDREGASVRRVIRRGGRPSLDSTPPDPPRQLSWRNGGSPSPLLGFPPPRLTSAPPVEKSPIPAESFSPPTERSAQPDGREPKAGMGLLLSRSASLLAGHKRIPSAVCHARWSGRMTTSRCHGVAGRGRAALGGHRMTRGAVAWQRGSVTRWRGGAGWCGPADA